MFLFKSKALKGNHFYVLSRQLSFSFVFLALFILNNVNMKHEAADY